MISRFLVQKRLAGDWKETTLIPSQGRVISQMILLVGLGRAKEYSYLRLRELSPYLFEVLKKLHVSNICLSLPYEESYNVDCGKLTEVLIEGLVDCLDDEWIKGIRLFLATEEKELPEILLGLQTAQSILQGRLKLRILVPGDSHL